MDTAPATPPDASRSASVNEYLSPAVLVTPFDEALLVLLFCCFFARVNCSLSPLKIANCNALHGKTFITLTAFPLNNPATPSPRNTFAQTPITVFRLPRCPHHPVSWMIVRARSSGATSVLAHAPANPPAKS